MTELTTFVEQIHESFGNRKHLRIAEPYALKRKPAENDRTNHKQSPIKGMNGIYPQPFKQSWDFVKIWVDKDEEETEIWMLIHNILLQEIILGNKNKNTLKNWEWQKKKSLNK